MKKDQVALENFLRWFLDLEEIPVQTKMAFTGHLLKAGGFDAVAAMYVEIIMDYLIQISAEKTRLAKQNADWLQAAIDFEKNPETSVQVRTVKYATDKMEKLADNFKQGLHTYEAEENEKQETFEEINDEQKIEDLKRNF